MTLTEATALLDVAMGTVSLPVVKAYPEDLSKISDTTADENVGALVEEPTDGNV